MQITAFHSWRRAFPEADIILFGDVSSWEKEINYLGIKRAGLLEKGKAGGEVLNGMFRAASVHAAGRTTLYLNSDIILDESSRAAVSELKNLSAPWLGSARRWCLPKMTGIPPLNEADWKVFFLKAEQNGKWGEACALDVFLFRGLSFEQMPPFLIGHRGWDNWMIFEARRKGICVVDLSRVLRVIHCDHDYSYAEGNSSPGSRDGPLEDANMAMLGGDERIFHLGHATHEWRAGAVRRRSGWAFRQRELEKWQIQHPEQGWWWRPCRRLLHPILKIWQARTTKEERW